jgi:hypothetical protein
VARPGHAVGVAGLVAADGGQRAHVIESDDTGRTWRRGASLSALDGIVFDSVLVDQPVSIAIGPGEDNVGSTVYITGPHGVYRENESGLYDLVYNASVVQNLCMEDHRYGVVLSADWDLPAMRILTTSDGGRSWRQTATGPDGYTFLVSLAFIGDGYRAVLSDSRGDYYNWAVLSSSDGAAWSRIDGRHDLPPLKGGDGYWIAPERLYIVGRGASILRSSSMGASFDMVHDPVPGFFQPRRKSDSVDRVFRPLLSASDGRRIYVATRDLLLGRWTTVEVPAAVPTATDRSLRIVVRDGSFEVLDGDSHAEVTHYITLFDVLGRRVMTAAVRARPASRFDLSYLPPGAYLAEVRAGRRILQQFIPLK